MTSLAIPEWVPVLAVAPFVGSFLATVVVRLPAARGVTFGRSACPRCGHVLGVAELVPLASWLAFRGRCRHCGGAIGALYPAVELAALAVAIWAAAMVPGWLLWASCVLGWGLLALALIDARHLLLPDALTLPLAAAGLVVAALLGFETLIAAVIGAVAGLAVFAALGWGWRRLRGREGLGLGDAKLAAVAGAWLGWAGLPGAVALAALAALAAALLGALAGRSLSAERRIPFGPWLAGAIWLVWLYGPPVPAG